MKETMHAYNSFKDRFKLFASKERDILVNTLSNIFSMRIIGNKTHGDLAEIGISEFINQFMYDYESIHVGKDLFRSKSHEEDILIKSVVGSYKDVEIPVSLKAYGNGPLQLSTDKNSAIYSYLTQYGEKIENKDEINRIFASNEFLSLFSINVMPLIYDETQQKCNIMVFDFEKAKRNVYKILFIDKNERFDKITGDIVQSKGRAHPIYLFVDSQGSYICEVRYGDASANALQRGFWTHTKNASDYFDSLTNGWIDYSTNKTLVRLFAIALNASRRGQEEAQEVLQRDIERLKSEK